MMKKCLILLCFAPLFSIAQNYKWQQLSNFEERIETYAYVPKVEKEQNWFVDFENISSFIENNLPVHTGAEAKITLPMPNGDLSNFILKESGTLSRELQMKFPDIRCFKAYNVNDPSQQLSITISKYNGLNIAGYDNKGTFYVSPIDQNFDHYMAYYSDDIQEHKELVCGNLDAHHSGQVLSLANADAEVSDGILRTYRFAVATTTQFSEYHYTAAGLENGTTEEKKAAVLAALATLMNEINLIFNRDVGVHLELIPRNDEIIFIDSDEYSDLDFGDAATDNVKVLRNTIGSNSFDLGHVFTTLGGGVGAYDAVCNSWDELKANGSAGTNPPIGHDFIALACHEIGHQFNGSHTHSSSACAFADDEAVEPGGGSTILSYANSCIPSMQDHSDLYFHANSIAQMRAFVLGNADACAMKTTTTNEEPSISPLGSYTVPISTSLILDAQVADAEDDNLTYCWEQFDFKIIGFDSIQQPTTVIGPLIRSLDPSASSHRYLPNMETILNGDPWNRWEIIPSVSRSMKFKLTVRDNNPDIVQVNDADMDIHFTNSAGPFLITNHNTSTMWEPNSQQTITWDVANTDGDIVNTPDVVILFSTDSGKTFDIVLADSTPNDGMHEITVPDVSTNAGRIMVRGKDNIFLDVNNANISIEGSSSANQQEVGHNTFEVYPNPNFGNFEVRAKLKTGEYQLELYDIQGNICLKDQFLHLGGELRRNYVLDAAAGVYIMKIIGSGELLVRKVTIH